MEEAKERMLRMIYDYINEAPEVISCIRSHDFAQRSYSNWAAKELLRYIESRKSYPPLLALEDFKDRMDKYSCLNPNTSYIFSVAYDMAEYVINSILN